MKDTRISWGLHVWPCTFVIGVAAAAFTLHQHSSDAQEEGPTRGAVPTVISGERQPLSANDKPKYMADEQHRSSLLDSFSITGDGDPILLPVTIEGKEFLFMLDTGTALHIFDSSLKHLLGTPVPAGAPRNAAPIVPGDLYQTPTARIGKLDLAKDDFSTTTDLKSIRYVSGKNVSGILGAPFFKRHVVQIDWDCGKLRVFRLGTEPKPDWGQRLPIEFDKAGGPLLEAVLGTDTPGRFLISTGANTTGSLSADLFNRLVADGLLRITSDRRLITLDRTVRRRTGRLGKVSIGPFEHQGLIFHEDSLNKLGLPYLARYRVTFDFARKAVYLGKAKHFSRIDHEDMSGLHLVRVEGKTIVVSVDEDSPAHISDLRAGDVILRVGDRPASEYELTAIRRLLRSANGTQVELSYERTRREKTVTIRLREKQPSTAAPE